MGTNILEGLAVPFFKVEQKSQPWGWRQYEETSFIYWGRKKYVLWKNSTYAQNCI